MVAAKRPRGAAGASQVTRFLSGNELAAISARRSATRPGMTPSCGRMPAVSGEPSRTRPMMPRWSHDEAGPACSYRYSAGVPSLISTPAESHSRSRLAAAWLPPAASPGRMRRTTLCGSAARRCSRLPPLITSYGGEVTLAMPLTRSRA